MSYEMLTFIVFVSFQKDRLGREARKQKENTVGIS